MSGSMYDGLDQVVSLVLGPFQPLLSVLPLLASTEELTLPCACVCVRVCVRVSQCVYPTTRLCAHSQLKVISPGVLQQTVTISETHTGRNNDEYMHMGVHIAIHIYCKPHHT